MTRIAQLHKEFLTKHMGKRATQKCMDNCVHLLKFLKLRKSQWISKLSFLGYKNGS